MNTKPNFIFKAFVCLFSLVCVANAFAQTENKPPPPQAEASYEIILQVVTASNAPGDNQPLSPSLTNVVKKLKTSFPFSNYRLTSTSLQRIADTGNVEHKSVTGDAANAANAPVFSEWKVGYLKSMPNAQGANSFQMQNFRFGQRVPIHSANGGSGGNEGKTMSVYVYESIGLTLQKLVVAENTPTVVGSLSSAKPDEIIFLILTVRTAE